MKSGNVTSQVFNGSALPDPLDLRPHVEFVMRRLHDMVEQSAEGQPVILEIGEKHNSAIDTLFQQLLIARAGSYAKDYGANFAVSYELHHGEDYLDYYVQDRLKWFVPAGISLKSHDADGAHALLARLASMPSHSLASEANLYAHCLQNRIPFRFNDLPYDNNQYCHESHPKTAEIMAELGITGAGSVHNQSIPGMAVRNLAMAQNAQKHLRETGTKIYIMVTGARHVLNDTRDNLSPEYSLDGQLKNLGLLTIPVMMKDDRYRYALSDEDCKDALLIDGIDRVTFDTSDQEVAFMQQVSAASGGEIALHDNIVDRSPWQVAGARQAYIWMREAQGLPVAALSI